MDMLFIALATYVICGCLYGTVAVSSFKNNQRWTEDVDAVKAGMYIVFLLSIGFWPVYLYRDIKDA